MLSVAAVTGLLPDVGMNSSQYSWASSIIYLGYLVYQGKCCMNFLFFETPSKV
jgi:hypothetical protein